MSESTESIQVTLPQILDLALGTPEVGSVNFNILHNFLHILLCQLNLQHTNVEYRDDNAERIKAVLESLKSRPGLYIQEHVITNATVDTADSEENSSARKIPSDTLSSVTAMTNTQQSPQNKPEDTLLTVAPQTSSDLSKEVEHLNDRVTKVETDLVYLHDDLGDLRETYKTLPAAEGDTMIIDEEESIKIHSPDDASKNPIDSQPSELIRDEASKSPIDAQPSKLIRDDKSKSKVKETEGSKAIVNDLSSAHVSGQQTPMISRRSSVIAGVDLKKLNDDVAELKNDMSQTKQEVLEMRQHVDQLAHFAEYPPDRSTATEMAPKIGAVSSAGISGPLNGRLTPPPPPPSAHELVHPSRDSQIATTAVNDYGDSENSVNINIIEPSLLKSASTYDEEESSPTLESRNSSLRGSQEIIIDDQIQILQSPSYTRRMDGSMNDIQRLENVFQEALRRLESRVNELEKNITNIEVPTGNNDGTQTNEEFVARIRDIEREIQRINQSAGKIAEERGERESHANILMEQIELLKTIKADKEDLEDALADKADAEIVNRKVSYDHFDTACDDLARGLEAAISKLTQQESVWHQALDTVQQEIDGKLDKIEISPIREFVNSRLQTLQEKIKEIADKKRENEAAGTRKILTGLQCISCDRSAVMRMSQDTSYRINSMPSRPNIKPYLTYELDQIRKHRKMLPSRNVNQLIGAGNEMGKKSKESQENIAERPLSRGHLCNRYCGGSHTITNAQQRVMRMGHVLSQFGPEAVQLTEGLIRGTDGQLYHSRPLPPGTTIATVPDFCGPGGNVCCGGSNLKSNTQQVERQGFDSSITNQRKTSQKDQRKTSSRLNSQVKDTKTSQKLNESLPSAAPPQIILDDAEEYIEIGENNQILGEDEE